MVVVVRGDGDSGGHRQLSGHLYHLVQSRDAHQDESILVELVGCRSVDRTAQRAVQLCVHD